MTGKSVVDAYRTAWEAMDPTIVVPSGRDPSTLPPGTGWRYKITPTSVRSRRSSCSSSNFRTLRPGTVKLNALRPHEREILQLIARGMSNREIAAALVVEESTIRTHVKRILMKLDLRDRVQAVIFACETGVNRPSGGAKPTHPPTEP